MKRIKIGDVRMLCNDAVLKYYAYQEAFDAATNTGMCLKSDRVQRSSFDYDFLLLRYTQKSIELDEIERRIKSMHKDILNIIHKFDDDRQAYVIEKLYLGDRISRKHYILKPWSVTDVAEELGISKAEVREIERLGVEAFNKIIKQEWKNANTVAI